MRDPRAVVVLVVAVLAAAGCSDAWAQPRHDAGVSHPTHPTHPTHPAHLARHGDAGTVADVTVRPPTHGTIDQAAAQRVLRSQSHAVQHCYELALQRDATLHGEVVVRLRVEPDGTVSETSSGGEDSLRPVGTCIAGVLAHVVFPQPEGGAATVTAPFVFAAGE